MSNPTPAGNRRDRPARFLLLSLILLTLLTPASAQTPAASPTPEGSPTAVPSPPLAPVVAPEFLTPRDSLNAFMLLMQEGGALRPGPLAKARTHLDLSAIPTVVREERGAMLCQQLYRILEAAQLNLDVLEVAPEQNIVVVYRQPGGQALTMARQLDGRWLVSSETVVAIPEMYKVLSDKGRIQVRHIKALDFEFLGLHGEQWLGLLLLPSIAYLAGLLLALVAGAVGRRLLKHLPLGKAVEERQALRPLGWVIATFILWAGLPGLALPSRLLVVLIVLVKVGAAAALVQCAFRFTNALSDYAETFTQRTETKFDDMLVPLARRTMKVALAVLGLLFLAQNLDIEVWSLFAGFSIFGAMVALAGQDMVKNIFGSITVFTDHPFRSGDWVKIEGIEGVVQDVGFRSTRLRSPAGSMITLPNSRLITAAVDNLGLKPFKQWTKRLRFEWTSSPQKLEAFCEGVRELVRQHPYTRKEAFQVWVHDLNDYAIEVLVDVSWSVPDGNTELRERHRFVLDILRLAAELELPLMAPAQQMVMWPSAAADPESFDREAQFQATRRGREAASELLADSLPPGEPQPAAPGEGLAPLSTARG